MKLKTAISLLFIASFSTFFLACSGAETKKQSEVVIDKSSTGSTSTDEVVITNADVKKNSAQPEQVSSTMPGGSAVNRTLGDNSQVDTITDAFGNKIETRYFPGHPRLRMLIVRTSVNGVQEVTVYGKGGDTKLVNGLADRAMTASAEEIANSADLTSTAGNGGARDFMKRQPSQLPETQKLQPLPSSAFQQPVSQPLQNSQPPTSSQSLSAQPATPEDEDED